MVHTSELLYQTSGYRHHVGATAPAAAPAILPPLLLVAFALNCFITAELYHKDTIILPPLRLLVTVVANSIGPRARRMPMKTKGLRTLGGTPR